MMTGNEKLENVERREAWPDSHKILICHCSIVVTRQWWAPDVPVPWGNVERERERERESYTRPMNAGGTAADR